MNSNKYEKLRKRNIEIQEESLKKIMPLAKQLSKQLSERSEKIKADKHKKSVKFRDNSKLVENNNRNKSNNSSKIPNKVHATNTSINLNELAGMSTSNTSGTIENDDDSLILPNLANVSNLDGTEFGQSKQSSSNKYSTRNNNNNQSNHQNSVSSDDEYDGYHNNEHLETITPKPRATRNTRSIGL